MTQPAPPPDELLAMFRKEPKNAQLALYVGAELESAGRLEEAVAVWSIGDDTDSAVRRVKDHPQAHPLMREHSARADAALCDFLTEMHASAVSEFSKESGEDVSRVEAGIWCMTHSLPFDFRRPHQRPMIFYMPDLPAEPVTAHEKLPWATALESSWQDIRSEYEEVVRNRNAMTPYVPANIPAEEWKKLSGTLDWGAIYLFKGMQQTQHARHFPKTLAALKQADIVRIDGVPMEAFFSRLTPGAHIPPHHGLTNTRLTVHLPLIVPEDCAIRVGTEEHGWEEGRITGFDDSFEHEAWNRSASDRVVLIFETHHPDLTPVERGAIEHTYSVRQNWLQNRGKLLGL